MSGPTADPRRADLDRRVLDWLRESAGERFDDLELNMLVLAAVETKVEHSGSHIGTFYYSGDQGRTLR